MTDEPPTHPTEPDPSGAGPPVPGAVGPLDERLSAELDGEATPEPGDAADDADPGADERRRALTDARDLLAVPPPPLDDVIRRRMVRAAVAERVQGETRDRRRLNQIGKAAALLAVIVAGGLAIKALGNSSENGSKSSSMAGSSGTTTAPAAAPFDLRDVSNPKVLQQRVAAALRAKVSTTSGRAPATTGVSAIPNQNDTARDDSRCLSTVTRSQGAGPLRVLADATYKGAPAVIAVATNDSGTAVYVLARSDCRLLTYQFLKR
jgi:hypothetical protein